jgi:hypothetical protein
MFTVIKAGISIQPSSGESINAIHLKSLLRLIVMTNLLFFPLSLIDVCHIPSASIFA